MICLGLFISWFCCFSEYTQQFFNFCFNHADSLGSFHLHFDLFVFLFYAGHRNEGMEGSARVVCFQVTVVSVRIWHVLNGQVWTQLSDSHLICYKSFDILCVCFHRYRKHVLSYSECRCGWGTWLQSSYAGLHWCCSAPSPTDRLACSYHRSRTHSIGRHKASLSPCTNQMRVVLKINQKKNRSIIRWQQNCKSWLMFLSTWALSTFLLGTI